MSWVHLRRGDPAPPSASTSVSTNRRSFLSAEEDELPWQVIYIGDPNMVRVCVHLCAATRT